MYGSFIRLLTLCGLYLCFDLALAGVIGSRHRAPSLNREGELSPISTPLLSHAQKIREATSMGNNEKLESSIHQSNMDKSLQNHENPEIFFPAGVEEAIVPSASLWELSVKSHRESNAHHNYATSDRAVAQEIALDFFSSAVVSCLLVDVPITAGRIKSAYSNIRSWPNYQKGSPTVKEGVALVSKALFRHYDVTDETDEVEIPPKPYEVEVTKSRTASTRLIEAWRSITGNKNFAATEKVKEYHLFFELVSYLKNNALSDRKRVWKMILPVMMEETELGKWMREVDNHKKLVVEFHEYSRETAGYEVTDVVAASHDNDKYIPFNLLAYTLKWYYGDIGVWL